MSDLRFRSLHWFVVVIAGGALALTLYNSAHETGAHVRAFPWLTPLGIMVLGVGGLAGASRPGLQRVLIALSMVLVVAGIFFLLRGF